MLLGLGPISAEAISELSTADQTGTDEFLELIANTNTLKIFLVELYPFQESA